MSLRSRLRAALRRVPLGLGSMAAKDHPAEGGITGDRDRDGGPDESDDDASER